MPGLARALGLFEALLPDNGVRSKERQRNGECGRVEILKALPSHQSCLYGAGRGQWERATPKVC